MPFFCFFLGEKAQILHTWKIQIYNFYINWLAFHPPKHIAKNKGILVTAQVFSRVFLVLGAHGLNFGDHHRGGVVVVGWWG